MLSDVEEKTYEFVMLRALGFNTKNLVLTVLIQAISFAIPGVVSGMILSAIINAIFRYVLFTLTKNFASYNLSDGSIYLGVFLGICIPIISNILPIKEALGKNLRTSLDLYHRSAGEITIVVQKLADLGLSLNQFILAIMLVVLGVICYYVAPSAFLFQNFSLFFMILNGLLLLMILGMTFISILLQPYL